MASGGLGKALIRRKNAERNAHRSSRAQAPSLQSVMEITDLDLVLEKAEEASRAFADSNPAPDVLSEESPEQFDKLSQQRREELLHQSSLTVPRRPKWHQKMTVEELDAQEHQAFLVWRRGLARLEQNEMLVLTPFEKNLQVWRQLWRVVERCHLVVMVVDARNPLFYRCPDLEAYVKEIDQNKRTLLLLNKADLLPLSIRKKWALYFKSVGLPCLFWSAKAATAVLEGKASADTVSDDGDVAILGREELLAFLQSEAEKIREKCDDENSNGPGSTSASWMDSAKRVAVGFVGYPNVGKSSTINVLVGQKCTGVTSTPGKTKHFQTLIISDKLMLCDCPGLVFPSFTSSKSDMVVAGVLPIDKMTDHRGPVQVIANQLPRQTLEGLYGFELPKPKPFEDARRPPTAAEVLRCYARSRGYVASRGLPDETKSARQILKDYLSGKLLHCHEPPVEGCETSETGNCESEEAEADADEHEEEEEVDDELSGGDEQQSEADEQTEEKLASIFKEVDLGKPQVAPSKVKRAAHKMHKKAPRTKNRSWRVKDDDGDGMALVKSVSKPVSYGCFHQLID